jgi:hypothetical protein
VAAVWGAVLLAAGAFGPVDEQISPRGDNIFCSGTEEWHVC